MFLCYSALSSANTSANLRKCISQFGFSKVTKDDLPSTLAHAYARSTLFGKYCPCYSPNPVNINLFDMLCAPARNEKQHAVNT